MEGDSMWRAAARVRVLLAFGADPAAIVASEPFWTDGDVRWLAGVNASEGKSWFNQEQFEEMVGWLQLPALIAAGEHSSNPLQETPVATVCEMAGEAGYEVKKFLELCGGRKDKATAKVLAAG
jgi:hypothetical protein